MRKAVITVFFISIILIAIGGIVKSVKNLQEERKRIEDAEIIENTEITEEMDKKYEEYISILLDNQEDFDYVAEMMMQWPNESYIDLKDGVSSKDQELADEIEKNEEFYEHLESLHELEEVRVVVKWKNKIEFALKTPPVGCSRSGWYYWEDTENGGIFKTIVIDEHWTLEIIPNT